MFVYFNKMNIKELNELWDKAAKDELEISILREALKFYADRSNWVTRSGRIGTSLIDIEDRELGTQEFPWAGGKLARKVLKEVMELRRGK